jgi:MYXO-CTERM domain-containing protein
VTIVDFIESILGVAPDGGSGALEMLLMIPMLGLYFLYRRRLRSR